MIKRLSANRPSFKTVEFSSGFNVVLADRTDLSQNRDSRNGLGKSTLIEIIHFCLGAKSSKKGKGLLVEELKGWEFSLEIEINGELFLITRGIDDPNIVFIEGNTSSWALKPKKKKGGFVYTIGAWNILLGNLFYGLPIESNIQYQPTFRALISYCIRRGKDAFSTPFEHHRKQIEWSKQVNNAFLLGLAWNDASELQKIKEKKKVLLGLKKAAKTGIVKGFVGSLGELEARRVRLQSKADVDAENLKSFKVHPQYEEIRTQANRLTEEIHKDANKNITDGRMVSLYEKSLLEEGIPVQNSIQKLYADAGVSLPGITLRRIEDVQVFHNNIIENRKHFITSEIVRLKREISDREHVIQSKSNERARAMEVLQTHGALEEYTLVQKRYLEVLNELNSLVSSIENLKTCENGQSQLKIDQEVLQQKTRIDHEERRGVWEKAINLFNGFTEQLYNLTGRLVIDVTPNGFKFDVEIERSESSGVGNMKIFCYDITLVSLWSDAGRSPKILIHDSVIFDGVDERQQAAALQIAEKESVTKKFQYICMLNSDVVAQLEFPLQFNLNSFVRTTLTDDNISGSLLGIRF